MSRLSAPQDFRLAELRRFKLLENASDALLETFAGRCTWRHFDAGQCIVSRETPDRDVFFLIRGAVRVVAFSAAGRQLTYRDLHPGEWFGDLSAVDGVPRSADVYASTATVLVVLDASTFLHLLQSSPAMSAAMIKHLTAMVRDLSARLFDLSSLGVRNRVHAELLRLAREAGVHENRSSIRPPPRHADIASRVSTYREQVTRELSALARRGIVERKAGALVVPDVNRLADMVERTRDGAPEDKE